MDDTFNKVTADLNKGIFYPLYFLQGEENYFIDYIADFIEAHALPEAQRAFNQVVLYGRDTNMAAVLNHARRFPMMADRQVVIVREAQDIPDLNKETGVKLLLQYIRQPVPSTILVFCHKNKSLDKRKEPGKTVSKMEGALTFKKLYDNQLPDFVNRYLRENNMKAEPGAVQMLCDLVGNDLSRLVNEIEKLRIDLKEDQPVMVNHVLDCVGVSREYNIFELQKALVRADRLAAANITAYFRSNTRRNPVIPAVAFLYAFFSRLLVAAGLDKKDEKTIASALKISPFTARDYSTALRYYSVPRLVQNIRLICEADLKLKGVDSGSASEGDIFRELVFRLMP
ncbi:MAG: DNA polymerase III subunit delta [Cyclobacteriaceae bacterium]|nr:MAG: DNA polymerase III subunit delta [Cyclobacteriaceae bacterium]